MRQILASLVVGLSLVSVGSSQLFAKEKASWPPKVGKLVPDFELKDANGKAYKLSDFRGNVVFINFWATWCPPCLEEMPSMEALNQRLKTKNFSMLAISVDDSWDEINGFLKGLNQKPSFLILHDPDKKLTTKKFKTVKFPETYLIGPDGRLLKKYAGAFNWASGPEFDEILGFLKKTK